MPLYTYVAITEDGKELAGEGVADTETVLRSDLANRGLLVQRIRPKRVGLGWRTGRIAPQNFALFNHEFMALVRAGLTVPDALALAAERPDCPALGKVLRRVHEDVRNGAPLSDACARYPEAFERLYLAALRTGEKTGDLAPVLSRYQAYLRHRVATRKKISQAMAYPMFLMVALVVILAVLFAFVMPRFVAMYADLGADLPAPTRVLLAVVDRIDVVAPVLAAVALALVWIWRKWNVTENGRRQLDGLRERIPYIGELIRLATAGQIARSLSTLLAGGTPLVEALHTVSSSLANQIYLDRLQAATERVTGGMSLAQAARVTALMPPMAVRMIEVGEASGGLETMLAEVAEFYEELLDARLARVMALVEPMLMLLTGVLIGGIIIVMYLPVFHMADIIK